MEYKCPKIPMGMLTYTKKEFKDLLNKVEALLEENEKKDRQLVKFTDKACDTFCRIHCPTLCKYGEPCECGGRIHQDCKEYKIFRKSLEE